MGSLFKSDPSSNDCWDIFLFFFSSYSGIEPFQEEATSLTRADRFSSCCTGEDALEERTRADR